MTSRLCRGPGRAFCCTTHPQQYLPFATRRPLSYVATHNFQHDKLVGRSFSELGLPECAVTKLHRAFPNVRRPTTTQKTFIPALFGGKDIVLSDTTGSGKTFALLLALWSRCISQTSTSRDTGESSLILTPHRDLALQCAYWVYRLNGTQPVDANPFVQLVLRSASEPLTDPARLGEIHSSSAPLFVGTPQAVLEVLQADREALRLRRFSTVVVDEVDTMVEIPPLPSAEKRTRSKFERNLKRHPSATRQILDMIYKDKEASVVGRRPQLVMMSATLGNYQRRWLQADSGWFVRKGGDVVSIFRSGPVSARRHVAASENIIHHAIVVSPTGELSNIAGAVEMPSSSTAVGAKGGVEEPAQQAAPAVVAPELKDVGEFDGAPSPFNASALEAIGLTFALEVPRVALLVLPASAAVRRAVHDLRTLGVNAHGLDVLHAERGGAYLKTKARGATRVDLDADPTLLVSTLASTRGLDLPELSHVFLLGLGGDGSVDTYVHVAGRVGRSAKKGKVISVVEERGGAVEGLQRTLAQLGVVPARLGHFG